MGIWDSYKDFATAPVNWLTGGNQPNPADSAMPYYNRIPGEMHKYFDPYINRGNKAGNMLEGQYGSLLNDPGGMLNKMGGSYQQSPGFKFALQQALQGAQHSAAAGGMAGSPQNQQQSMELATNLANQDYNNWIQHAMGLYGRGLGGEENMYGIGAHAGMGLGTDLSSLLAQQGNLAYAGQAGQNQGRSQGISNLIGAAGTLAAFM